MLPPGSPFLGGFRGLFWCHYPLHSEVRQDEGMSTMESIKNVEVGLTAKDMADIAVLRAQSPGLHADEMRHEDSEEFMRRVILAGIQKMREEQADASYAMMAEDPEYREYHERRREARTRRR